MFHNASYRPTPMPTPSGAVARHLLFTSCSSRGYSSPASLRSPTFLIGLDISESTFRGTKTTRGLSDFSPLRERERERDRHRHRVHLRWRRRKSWRVAERNKCRVTARRFVNGSTSRGGKQITSRTSRSKEKETTDPSVENKFETVSPIFQTAVTTTLLLNTCVYICIYEEK